MKRCEICGKGKKLVIKRKKLRSKYNPVKKSWQKPNLQFLKIDDKRVLVCKDCRRLILKGKEK
jgi:ribosomal protein L28